MGKPACSKNWCLVMGHESWWPRTPRDIVRSRRPDPPQSVESGADSSGQVPNSQASCSSIFWEFFSSLKCESFEMYCSSSFWEVFFKSDKSSTLIPSETWTPRQKYHYITLRWLLYRWTHISTVGTCLARPSTNAQVFKIVDHKFSILSELTSRDVPPKYYVEL